MRDTLLKRIWFSCRHQFSWPRRSEEGGYYQVCLQCGVKYRYDWHAMQRTTRLEGGAETDSAVARKTSRKCNGKGGWQPRERRLRIEVPVRFRKRHITADWRLGESENISRSGLLFAVEGEVPAVDTKLELVFVMPAEICGSSPAEVLCQARAVRVREASAHQPAKVAATILDYVYLPQTEVG